MADQFIQEARDGRVLGKWRAWWYGVRHGVDWSIEARVVLLFTSVVGGVAIVCASPALFVTGTVYIAVSTLGKAVVGGTRGLMALAETEAWLGVHPHEHPGILSHLVVAA